MQQRLSEIQARCDAALLPCPDDPTSENVEVWARAQSNLKKHALDDLVYVLNKLYASQQELRITRQDFWRVSAELTNLKGDP